MSIAADIAQVQPTIIPTTLLWTVMMACLYLPFPPSFWLDPGGRHSLVFLSRFGLTGHTDWLFCQAAKGFWTFASCLFSPLSR
jgi:hypothetical protein